MATSVTFYGVRGSTPCASESSRRYGGNTSCVVVTPDDDPPIVLDLGTGLRFFGLNATHRAPFRASALVTHLHWDHVQGIPFFQPLLTEGSVLDLYGPRQLGESLAATISGFLSPPYFPVGIADLPCEIRFHELGSGSFDLPGAKVRSSWVPHIGPTLGYRVDCGGMSVAYVSDHQQPGISNYDVSDDVLELCAGADLLIHDAQYDVFEFSLRSDWGHCSVDYAIEVASRAGVGTLALFHHDPSHNDTQLDELAATASLRGRARGIDEVLVAHEGLTINFSSEPGESVLDLTQPSTIVTAAQQVFT